MKKLITLCFILFMSGILNISLAQTCTPDTTGYASVPDSGVIIPSPLPNAQVGVYYEQVITFGVPDSASGFPLNWLQFNNATNYLTGNTWTIVDSAGGSTFPHWPKLTWHCATIKGTPTVAGTDSIIIYVNANVTILSFPFTYNNTRAGALPLVVDPVVGINDLSNNNDQLQVFPNPYNDKIQITISSAEYDNATLYVYTTLGQLIYSETKTIQPGKNYFSYNGSSLDKGIYLFSVITSDNTYNKNIVRIE